MKKLIKIFVVVLCLIGLLIHMPLAQTNIPLTITYVATLVDINDNLITGEITITIRLYDQEEDGIPIWQEEHTATSVDGYVRIELGTITTFSTLDFNEPYWYSIEIESDGEMIPRYPLTSVAYSVNADRLDGYDSGEFAKTTEPIVLEEDIAIKKTKKVILDSDDNGDTYFTVDEDGTVKCVVDGTVVFTIKKN